MLPLLKHITCSTLAGLPNLYNFKFDEEFQAIPLTGIKRGRSTDVSSISDELPRMYQAKLPISAVNKNLKLN